MAALCQKQPVIMWFPKVASQYKAAIGIKFRLPGMEQMRLLHAVLVCRLYALKSISYQTLLSLHTYLVFGLKVVSNNPYVQGRMASTTVAP